MFSCMFVASMGGGKVRSLLPTLLGDVHNVTFLRGLWAAQTFLLPEHLHLNLATHI